MYSFPMNDNEKILKKGMASLHCGSEAFNGALYLTNERLAFVGYMLDLTNKYLLETPLEHITELKKEKTFFVFSNVIAVSTLREKNFKILLQKRDEWFQAIMQQIKMVK